MDAKTRTERIKAGDSQHPTDIVGQPVKEAKYVFWEEQRIGRVWSEGPRAGAPESWSWALYEITGERTRGRVILGGTQPTEKEATGMLLHCEELQRDNRLEGTRPRTPEPRGDARGR